MPVRVPDTLSGIISVRVKGGSGATPGRRYAPMTCNRLLSAAAALAVSLPLAALPLRADVLAGGHELVVLAEPAAPAAPGISGPIDLTLTWTVREVFAGEPSSVTLAVRHEGLEPAQVKSLAAGDRWILLADRDPKRPGRWVASMPLRATPAAIDAFRKWSAPPDVRPERDLDSVVAEVRDEEPPPRAPADERAELPEPGPEPESAVAEGPVVEPVVAEVPEAPVDRDLAPVESASVSVEEAPRWHPTPVTETTEAAPSASTSTPAAKRAATARERWMQDRARRAGPGVDSQEPVEVTRIAEADLAPEPPTLVRTTPQRSERR